MKYGILSDRNITPPDIITSGCSSSTIDITSNNTASDTAAATRDDTFVQMGNSASYIYVCGVLIKYSGGFCYMEHQTP